MENEQFEVRDLRKRPYVIIDKVILFHPDISATAYKVYSGLASYADNATQQAFPGINTLKQRLNLSRNTIMRGLKELEEVKAIKVERTRGMSNIYFLLDLEDSKPIRKSKPVKDSIGDGVEVNKLIECFKPLNPSYDRFYKQTVEREAAGRLIKKFGFEKMMNTVNHLPEIVIQKTAPRITSPRQLETDLGKLIIFIKQQEGNKTKEIVGL